MPRANRHYIPGQVWHITHRCHKKEFLLKFRKDRKRWQHWLFKAKKRFGLQILNYMVTSSHYHMVVIDGGDRDVLPKSIQLIAGRTAQEFNKRKKRRGAFWEDRYHATAIESGEHFIQCMIYIDLNMVRAGVVNHPTEWPDYGYHEIVNPLPRYSIINHPKLMELAGIKSIESLKNNYAEWIANSIQNENYEHQSKWTSSIAVGSENYIDEIKNILGIKAAGRRKIISQDACELREPTSPYNDTLIPERVTLRQKNMHYWNI